MSIEIVHNGSRFKAFAAVFTWELLLKIMMSDVGDRVSLAVYYMVDFMVKLVAAAFDHSISNLVSVFTGGKKLSGKDAKGLGKLI